MAKDKAIKRFLVRNIVDASAIRDLQDSSVIEGKPLFTKSVSTQSWLGMNQVSQDSAQFL